MEQEKYCPKCGYKNDLDSLFCVACGNNYLQFKTTLNKKILKKNKQQFQLRTHQKEIAFLQSVEKMTKYKRLVR